MIGVILTRDVELGGEILLADGARREVEDIVAIPLIQRGWAECALPRDFARLVHLGKVVANLQTMRLIEPPTMPEAIH